MPGWLPPALTSMQCPLPPAAHKAFSVAAGLVLLCLLHYAESEEPMLPPAPCRCFSARLVATSAEEQAVSTATCSTQTAWHLIQLSVVIMPSMAHTAGRASVWPTMQSGIMHA